jgi:hypothetical protein
VGILLQVGVSMVMDGVFHLLLNLLLIKMLMLMLMIKMNMMKKHNKKKMFQNLPMKKRNN